MRRIRWSAAAVPTTFVKYLRRANTPPIPSRMERLFLSLIVGMGKRDRDREREGKETFWHGHANNVYTVSTAREVCNGRKPLLTKIKTRPGKDPSLFHLVCGGGGGSGVQSRVCANEQGEGRALFRLLSHSRIRCASRRSGISAPPHREGGGASEPQRFCSQ